MTVRVSRRLPYTSDEIAAAIRARFCQPEWACFFEVADGTGVRQHRWADAVAVNCYPSRGLEIHGMEIKVYRGDWKRELANPEKSGPVQRYCDRWWVCAPDGVVPKDDVPVTWGLLELKDGKLVITKQAPPLKPEAITKEFATALFRAAAKTSESHVEILVQKRTAEVEASANRQVEQELARRRDTGVEVMKRAQRLKELCGIDLIHGYEPTERVAAAIRFAMSSNLLGTYNSVRSIAEQMGGSSKTILDALDKIGLTDEEKHG